MATLSPIFALNPAQVGWDTKRSTSTQGTEREPKANQPFALEDQELADQTDCLQVQTFGDTARSMSKRRSDWYIPGDWLAIFGMLVIIPSVAVLESMLLPAFAGLKTADVANLYAGVLGALLLFIARLPLYRAWRLWTFGPRLLDRRIIGIIGWPMLRSQSEYYFFGSYG